MARDDVIGELTGRLHVAARTRRYWKVPMRTWLRATRVSTAPGSGPSRQTVSPVATAASDRVVGTPERRHRLADDIFAKHRPKRRAAVAAPGEGRPAGTLQLDVPADAVAIDHLAQQDRPAVAELRDEHAELVARIGHRERIGAAQGCVASQHGDAFGEERAAGSRLRCPASFSFSRTSRGDAT